MGNKNTSSPIAPVVATNTTVLSLSSLYPCHNGQRRPIGSGTNANGNGLYRALYDFFITSPTTATASSPNGVPLALLSMIYEYALVPRYVTICNDAPRNRLEIYRYHTNQAATTNVDDNGDGNDDSDEKRAAPDTVTATPTPASTSSSSIRVVKDGNGHVHEHVRTSVACPSTTTGASFYNAQLIALTDDIIGVINIGGAPSQGIHTFTVYRYCISGNVWLQSLPTTATTKDEDSYGIIMQCDGETKKDIDHNGGWLDRFIWIPSLSSSSSSGPSGRWLVMNGTSHGDWYVSRRDELPMMMTKRPSVTPMMIPTHGNLKAYHQLMYPLSSSFPLHVPDSDHHYRGHTQDERCSPFVHTCVHYPSSSANGSGGHGAVTAPVPYLYHWRLYRDNAKAKARSTPSGGYRMNLHTGEWSSVSMPAIEPLPTSGVRLNAFVAIMPSHGARSDHSFMLPIDGYGILYMACQDGRNGHLQWLDSTTPGSVWQPIKHWSAPLLVPHHHQYSLPRQPYVKVIWDHDHDGASGSGGSGGSGHDETYYGNDVDAPADGQQPMIAPAAPAAPVLLSLASSSNDHSATGGVTKCSTTTATTTTTANHDDDKDGNRTNGITLIILMNMTEQGPIKYEMHFESIDHMIHDHYTTATATTTTTTPTDNATALSRYQWKQCVLPWCRSEQHIVIT